MTGRMEVVVDPAVTRALRTHLVRIWVDVTNAGGAVGFVPPVSAAEVRPLADEVLDRVAAGAVHLVVGSVEGDPIGFAFLEQRPGPLFRHWATVKRLQVHPSRQGQGRGAELLAGVVEAARTLGLEQLHLTVRGGTGTESFYLRHGFEIVARIPDVIRVAPGDDREELLLVRRLT